MLSNEELMKPRYKVIADYPFSIYKIGQVIELGFAHLNSTIEACKLGWDKYPHLFKPLQWWEERNPKDMPEYVKDGNFILKVKYKAAYDNMIYRSTLGNTWHNVYEFSNLVLSATLEEYQSYTNSLK